jgi:hypothetical protein
VEPDLGGQSPAASAPDIGSAVERRRHRPTPLPAILVVGDGNVPLSRVSMTHLLLSFGSDMNLPISITQCLVYGRATAFVTLRALIGR